MSSLPKIAGGKSMAMDSHRAVSDIEASIATIKKEIEYAEKQAAQLTSLRAELKEEQLELSNAKYYEKMKAKR